ncbi:unconventional prefoldin RPB5 interactor-like protein isoform X3 [Hermetia illucens]|uniref:unconventional prefoldin RPB5 interactor-like protein isoform X3 n=1 Tax=Hermetia illucens TaxID=343691 RepID=UPI0018CC0BA0|nr:unconventional prefoldin RPB5 interactor-like protein isoform X3 [Hermetia illucens]
MDKLEEALKEALSRNSDETGRWDKYREEQEICITNLTQFGEDLSVDVMVPIGSKAFMPGQIYHTNEILVSHFQGFFSKCSAKQALEIANHRINMARARLNCLEKEAEMYQNKLEKPYIDGALAGCEEKEIIEEYDEEKENLWRVQHRQNLRREKLKESSEKAQRKEEKAHEDVLKLLDELEMIEELEEELKKLQIEDDDTLKKMLSGKIQLPSERKRISHYEANDNIVVGDLAGNTKVQVYNEGFDFTNNNTVPNDADYASDEGSEASSVEDMPRYILEIEMEAKSLSVPQKIKFFKSKLQELESELHSIKVKSPSDIDEKIDKMELKDYLIDYIELLRDNLKNESFVGEKIVKTNVEEKKKRISFADQDEVQFIDKNRAVNVVTRSKVDLSEGSYKSLNLKPLKTLDSSRELTSCAPNSQEYKAENQNLQDCNLIDKILGLTEAQSFTFFIENYHSDNYFVHADHEIDNYKKSGVIGSPADIYKLFQDNSTDVECDESVVNKINDLDLGADTFQRKLNDIHLASSKETQEPGSGSLGICSSDGSIKSILKNREKVQLEAITSLNTHQPEVKIHQKSEECVFDKQLIGDVIEKEAADSKGLDPLPVEKFKDVKAPKKRISRFKQMRLNS